MSGYRSFVCIELPEDIRKILADLQNRLRPLAKGTVRWPRAEGLHLTLKFLGDVELDRLDAAADALMRGCAESHGFQLCLRGTGAFPDLRSPRVLWAGLVEPSGELEKLQARIEKAFRAAGFAAEERPFSPHLTIARVKAPREAAALTRRWQVTSLENLWFSVEEVVLMRSDLRSDGAVYTPLRRARLTKVV
ncbi:RNA 2',3'-cyclic phosphodiesterase [bacterium]|nr:RNA 2',3'-cyclic phosphodiesterase [bacterium]